MNRSGKRNRRIAWAGVVALAFALGAIAPVSAQHGPKTGPLSIKGKRWVNGVETSVKCNAKEGHLLRFSDGDRFLLISPSPSCAIFEEGVATPPGPYHGLRFTGPEFDVSAHGRPQRRTTFVGFETLVDDVDGTLSSTIRLDASGGAKSDTGTFAYVRLFNGDTIMFAGRYRAKLGN